MNAIKEQIATLQQEMEAADQAIRDDYNAKINTLQGEIDDLQAQIDALNELYQNYLDKNNINENKNFYLLDKKTWDKIKLDYKEESEVKVNGLYIHNKYKFQINKFIY